jgi:hypothetical protein
MTIEGPDERQASQRPVRSGPHRGTVRLAAVTVCGLMLCELAPTLALAAQNVPNGCDLPKTIPDARTFYIDPAKGSPDGDGSQSRPWRTLEEVLDPARRLVATDLLTHQPDGSFLRRANGNPGPIKPGDTLVLASGDHGEVRFKQYINSDFISVVAGPGQTPIVRFLSAVTFSHWLFRGIKFQNELPTPGASSPLVTFSDHGFLGPADNLIVQDSSFSTRDDVSGWTDRDWVDRPYTLAFSSTVHCATLAGNHFYNLRNAAGISGDTALVENNRFEAIGNDSIEMTGSNLIIRRNTITDNRHTEAEPLHADGIQGWTLRGAINRNVIIDSNIIVNTNSDATNYMHGISIFNGAWEGVVVSNNVVATNTWNAIVLAGVHNGLVINNTVVATARTRHRESWIKIAATKENPDNVSAIVRNNIAPNIIIERPDVIVDHNLTKNRVQFYKKEPGPVDHSADNNIVDVGLEFNFLEFEPQNSKVDLRLKQDSGAMRAGSSDRAPSKDVEGRGRVAPIDIGAYARP